MQPMRLLIFNLDQPDPSPLLRLWTAAGHSVLSVTAAPSTDAPTAGGSSQTRSPSAANGQGLQTLVLNLPAAGPVPKAIDLVRRRLALRRALGSDLKSFIPDVVIAASFDQTDNYAASQIAKTHRAVFIRQTDSLPSNPSTTAPSSPPKSLPARLIDSAERFACRHAHMIVTSLPDSFEHLHARGLDRERWIYLPSSAPASDLPIISNDYLRLFSVLLQRKHR